MDRLDEYAAALALYESWLDERRAGTSDEPEAFLARHPDLRDILGPLVAADATATTPADADAAPRWIGLPGPGERFGAYRIESLLGQGGMGAVFLARDERLERAVALKLIRPERLFSSVAKERFWREAKLVARLEHPGICPIYEVGEENGIPFLAMRALQGETLAQRIAAGGPRDWREIVALGAQLARALHHAHERGIVHRDVKPGNVMLTADGPLLLDFGVARDDSDAALTMTGELTGTPLYMAPEQVAPNGRVPDRTADVYALGATLYEAIAGQRMLDGVSLRELLEAVLRRDPAPLSRLRPDAPRDLDVVIAKAIDKDRQRRYRTALDFADDLERVLRNEPVRARRAGPASRAWRWTQRNPLAAAFVGLLVVALATTAFLYNRSEKARADFDFAAQAIELRRLQESEPQLWDAWPDHAPALRAWLREADAFVAALPGLRAMRDELARRSRNRTDEFLLETLNDLLPEADRFVAPRDGLLARVRALADWAGREQRETIDAQREAWQRARAEILADARYRGLDLAPQLGLVPLGPDPDTGLQEFLHARSGEPPQRDGARWRIADDTGIVFVLLPGGAFRMGAQAQAREEPNFDREARADEGPVHEVALAPFFVGKYPVTQGQWLALRPGRNPAQYFAGIKARSGEVLATLAHPIENITWHEAAETLRWHGLLLPTEAQREYACRAGTATPWWTGDSKDTLSQRANVADRAAQAAGAEWSQIDASLEDGFAVHAPVDSLAPNAFGLFHVHGNVWEWCRDWFAYYEHPAAPGDGLREPPRPAEKVIRGGSFDFGWTHARSAHRRLAAPATRANNIGLRAARAIR
jgi:formylglycine-generating enzyme required for sulfatase activity